FLAALLFFYASPAPRDLPSFPTRRSSDLRAGTVHAQTLGHDDHPPRLLRDRGGDPHVRHHLGDGSVGGPREPVRGSCRSRPRTGDRKSTRLNSSHVKISYAVFCLKKKTNT